MRTLIILLSLWASTAACAAESVEALPTLNIDIHETSISGLSSGGFMAVQFQVAHSTIVKGAGIVAAGPYYCAQGSALTATTRCSCTLDAAHGMCSVSADSTDIKTLEKATQRFAADGAIDDPKYLARQRSFLIAGGKDKTVPKAVVGQLRDYLVDMGAPQDNLTLAELADSGHGMPTPDYGGACDVTGEPYIDHCNFDAAGKILGWIYGPEALQPARKGARQGRLIHFDQRPFGPTGYWSSWTSGLDSTGWLYVPNSCAKGEACRLHVALHGCKQGQSYSPAYWPGGATFGKTFIEHAGYDAWADSNHLVILYPQAVSVLFRNPNGCWDWWGYTGGDYATRDGVQIHAIRAMVDRLAAGRK
jgi:poly(3-hydroxybutyrate) depolymerase